MAWDFVVSFARDNDLRMVDSPPTPALAPVATAQ
jgi:hypothetical protein